MAGTPRNDPCPCGSGKKYKRCCLAKDEAATAPLTGGDLDARVGADVMEWIAERDPAGIRRAEAALGDRTRRMPGGEWIGFLTSLAAYELAAPDGRRWVEVYRESEGAALPPEDRRYLDAQIQSWFSVWEVRSVRPGEGFVLHDLLTGEERDVRERLGSTKIAVRHALCGRIVRRGLHFTYGAGSPFILPPRAAQAVVAAVRKGLGLGKGNVAPSALQGLAALPLAAEWSEAVERGYAPKPSPRLENTDGDPWLRVLDRYAFDPARRPAVMQALSRIPGAEMPEGAEAHELPAVVSLTRPGNPVHKSWTNTVIAHVRVAEDHLETETNSRRRAGDAARTIEAVLGDLVGQATRKEQSQAEATSQGRSAPSPTKPPALPDAERARIVREFKAREYAAWPDQCVPALGGKTPRAVARNRRLRAFHALELILKDMEHSESRLPAEECFDVGILRRELGMER